MYKNLIYVDNTGVIRLNETKLSVKAYDNLLKNSYHMSYYYLTHDRAEDLKINRISKHQLLELVDEEELDTSEIAWMEGIKLRTSDHNNEIEEIYNCGSREAYYASLPENLYAYIIRMNARIASLEMRVAELEGGK